MAPPSGETREHRRLAGVRPRSSAVSGQDATGWFARLRGRSLCLFYPSANRDEEIFPDGDVFRIDRSPNDHIGFGRGEHVCLGAHLGRLEIRAVFEELRTRLVRAEVAGPIDRVRSSFVGGIKRVPLRWEVGPARG
jgi:cytochrome P450